MQLMTTSRREWDHTRTPATSKPTRTAVVSQPSQLTIRHPQPTYFFGPNQAFFVTRVVVVPVWLLHLCRLSRDNVRGLTERALNSGREGGVPCDSYRVRAMCLSSTP